MRPFERAELAEVRGWAADQPTVSGAHTAQWLLGLLDRLVAALADAEIARRQAEAEAWAQIEAASRIEQERDRLAGQVRAVRERGDALLDGELAHRSRDYGRGVAQATKDMLAALDGPKDG